MLAELLNSRNLKRVLKNPALLCNMLVVWLSGNSIERGLAGRFFSSRAEFLQFKREAKESGLAEELGEKRAFFERTVKGVTYRKNIYSFGAMNLREATNIYCILRKLKPEIAVETGVCNGFSTSFILLALHKNRKGRLYSIDFPEVAGKKYGVGTFCEDKQGGVIPHGKKPGWAVPNRLRKRWRLIIGRSSQRLPPLLKKLGQIDFFVHDSEHSYGNMLFEFREAYAALRARGVLVSHDIDLNTSLQDFSGMKKKPITKIGVASGFIVK